MDVDQRQDPEPTLIGRRRLLKMLLGLPGAAALVAIVAGCGPGSTAAGRVLAGTTSDIPVGHGKVVAVGGSQAVVVNTTAGVKAFSAICTHQQCLVGFDTAQGVIVCPCHDGRFDPVTGAVLAGPPPAPLPAVPVSVVGSDIYVGSG